MVGPKVDWQRKKDHPTRAFPSLNWKLRSLNLEFIGQHFFCSLVISPSSGKRIFFGVSQNGPGEAGGGTEYSWCRAVTGGTGITVMAILLSRPPEPARLENTLRRIQSRHPLLLARLQWTDRNPTLSLSPTPYLSVEVIDSGATSGVLQSSDAGDPFHALLEHELNRNSWPETRIETPAALFFATVYQLPDSRAMLALRLHTAVCDRVSAVAILCDLRRMYGQEAAASETAGGGEEKNGNEEAGEVPGAIEEMVPQEKARKPFWAHGVDLLGYSLGSMRFSNLDFHDTTSARATRMVRLQMDRDDTHRLLEACRERGVKLGIALAAAALKAANNSKEEGSRPQSENYAVVTIVDCRPILAPPLQADDTGFYHSAILNTQSVNSQEDVWETAKRYFDSLSNAMRCNKHFTDMGDLNFLMCKAIDYPPATPYSSMRTSFIGIFESPIIDDDDSVNESCSEIGLEDYVGCSSVHGVGPSIAFFDTIKGGRLDCACLYPWPLHSREQMEQLVANMKTLLIASA
ncbi:uncharacterized protein LOC116259482 [Nymphaea colorata]|nr:uncharacterized protein LOC116259482 [Nymphaea colorata]